MYDATERKLEKVIQALKTAGYSPNQRGQQWNCRCPAHDDKKPSLSICEGNDGHVLICCHAGCETKAIVEAIGLRMADLMPPNDKPQKAAPSTLGQLVATYDYRDANDSLLFQVLRFEPKAFRQRKPKPGGDWEYSVSGVKKVPFKLPEILGRPDEPVYIVEGEKDVLTLERCEILATCNAAGAGKWTSEHAAHLAGRDVIVLPDNDNPGRSHAQAVAFSLAGLARSIKVVELPGLKDKGDVTDWLSTGGTVVQLQELVTSAAEWTAEGQEAQSSKGPWLVSLDEFCRQPAPMQWLVKRWIPRNALGMIHGPSGSGKTFFVLDMALRVASELDDWQGHKVKEGAVVILAGEGHAGLKARATAWRQQHNVSMWDGYISQSGVALDTREGVLHAIEAIKSLPKKPVLVVVDTVHCHMEGDENTAKDTGAMLASCRQIMAEFGCSVLLVHHTGHAEGARNRARGSSAWKAALDVEISVKPMDRVAIVEQVKNKDGTPAAPRAFAVKPVTIDGWVDEDGERVTSAVAIQAEVPQTKEKPNKLDEHKKLFQAAWFGTGAEVVGDRPYISRSALLHYLTTQRGLLNGTAETYVKPSRKGALIHDLTAAGIIEIAESGWAVADNNLSSSMVLQKQGAE